MIKTIEDFRKASKEEVQAAVKQVTVEDDLFAYLTWLNSSAGGETEVRFKVGWDRNRAESLGLHPSAIAKTGPCLLKLYFDVTGEVKPQNRTDVGTLMIFDLGTAGHALLQTHLRNMYEDQFEEEVWLRDKRILINSGHTDGRFNFTNIRFLLEVKTIKEGGNFGFEKVQDRPFPDNVRQVMTYMALDDCPFGLILYFCKNNSKLKEHVLCWSDKIWNGVMETSVTPVIKAVKEGKGPAADPGYHCRKCDYLHGCKAGKELKSGKRNRRRGVVPSRAGARYVRSW